MRRRVALALMIIVLVFAGILGARAVSMAQQGKEKDSRVEEMQEPTKEGFNNLSVNRNLLIEDSEVIAHGTIYLRLYIDLTDEEVRMINREHPRFLNRISLLGWQREGNRFFRMVSAKNVDLHFGDEIVSVKSGRYAFLAEEDSASEQRQELRRLIEEKRAKAGIKDGRAVLPFTMSVRGVTIPAKDLEVANFDAGIDESSPVKMDIIENIEYRTMKANMHHGHDSHGKSGSPMERCMDYNGPMSNGKNYAAHDPRAWVNFVCSDCDLAGAGRCVSCWNDHRVGGCQANHGKVCSKYIGHSSSYHKHKWSQCKYCL